MTGPLIEVLTLEGCPNEGPALDLVVRVVSDLGIDARVRRIHVADLTAAEVHRFLGSPTIRVNGNDVEPGAGERIDHTLACRVYRTEGGLHGSPDERWLREALQAPV